MFVCGYFPPRRLSSGFFHRCVLLVITDLRLTQGVAGSAFTVPFMEIYGFVCSLPFSMICSQVGAALRSSPPLLADPRIKSSAHKCQMIDLRTGSRPPPSPCSPTSPNFNRDAYYADLLLLISISKALFAGSCTIKTTATQDMN